ncbi:uncharacterized, partial [Tachysurus ichikawai]
SQNRVNFLYTAGTTELQITAGPLLQQDFYFLHTGTSQSLGAKLWDEVQLTRRLKQRLRKWK